MALRGQQHPKRSCCGAQREPQLRGKRQALSPKESVHRLGALPGSLRRVSGGFPASQLSSDPNPQLTTNRKLQQEQAARNGALEPENKAWEGLFHGI